jgi:hypothetical protein
MTTKDEDDADLILQRTAHGGRQRFSFLEKKTVILFLSLVREIEG